MPTYTQTDRLLAVTTPLGPDALLLETLSGVEAISQPFEFELGLLAPSETDVAFDQVLGQSATVQLLQLDGSQRYFNGIVVRFAEGGQVRGAYGDTTFVRYTATLVPKLWLLTRKAQSRIFQQKNVPDILKEVLAGLDVDWQLQGTYEPRDYCTQYRETDFAFASRLMEEEGIYYYFKHDDGSHTMVVADTPQGHVAVPGASTVRYETVVGGTRPDDRIFSWLKTQEMRSGKSTLWDHCFELPGQHLDASKAIQETVAAGTVTHKLKVGGNDQLELYDYPGGYAQRFDGINPGGGDRASDVQKIFSDNTRTVGIRMQQEAMPGLLIVGESTCRQLTAGHKFTLDKHFNADGDYVLTQVAHTASLVGTYTNEDPDDDEGYRNEFRAIPAALPFRPAQVTPKARVWGTQTAVVVCPPGEEIFTDKYGRVKVQFPWDRQGTNDANSSCWCRVATFWAGKQWGAIHIPRKDQEVIVAYEEGDPDRPIIVGSVYNADQMPPYKLPDNRTQSGVKSRSSLNGTPDNFNEFRFEDKKGSEQIYLHAEKNFDAVVENNETRKVGFEKADSGDQTIEIHNNQEIIVGKPSVAKTGPPVNPTEGSRFLDVWNNEEVTIGAGKDKAADGSQIVGIWNNQEVTIGSGKGQNADGSQLVSVWKNQELTIGKGEAQSGDGSQIVSIYKDRQVTLKTGNDVLDVSKGDRNVTIDMGNDALTIKMGNQTTKLNLGQSSTEAMQGIELKVGQSSIKLDQTGVTIKGMMISIQGQVQTEVKGVMTSIKGDAMLQAGGGITMIG